MPARFEGRADARDSAGGFDGAADDPVRFLAEVLGAAYREPELDLGTLSATNRFPGRVVQLARGEVMSKVVVEVEGGLRIERSLLPAAPVTRFAPSVTGSLHLGHVVNAAWTWALGTFVVAATSSIPLFYVMGGVFGALLGSLWTSTRPLLLSLTPAGEEGRLFGIYAFCNKAAAVIGPAGDSGSKFVRFEMRRLFGKKK